MRASSDPCSHAAGQPRRRIALAFQHLKAGRMAAAEKVARELALQERRGPAAAGAAGARTEPERAQRRSGRRGRRRARARPRLPARADRAGPARTRAAAIHALAAEALGRLVAAQPNNAALGYDLAVSLLELDRSTRPNASSGACWRSHPTWWRRASSSGWSRCGGATAAPRSSSSPCAAACARWLEAWLNRGAMLLNLEQPGAAAEAYGKALGARRRQRLRARRLCQRRARARRQRGAHHRARRRVTELNPGSAMAWLKLAFAYISNDQFLEQAEASERALALDPTTSPRASPCSRSRARWCIRTVPPRRSSCVPGARASRIFEQVDVAEPQHRVHLPLTLARGTNFYLHYIGEPFVDLQRRYAAMIARLAHAWSRPRPWRRCRGARASPGGCASA
jgi:tetratricopeptide (TPR) repeat protein